MEYRTTESTLRDLGFVIRADGALSRRQYTYGYFHEQYFIPYDDRILEISKIEDIVFVDSDKKLVFLYNDVEDVKTIYGVKNASLRSKMELDAVVRRATPYLSMQEEYDNIDTYHEMLTRQDPRELRRDMGDAYAGAKCPATIYELATTFDALFPKNGNQLYYDVLKENIMMDSTMVGGVGGVVPMDETLNSLYYFQMEARLVDLGFIGKPPAYAVRDHAIRIKAQENRRNPFIEWVTAHEWDGVPRVRRWFIDTFGAAAEPLRAMGAEDEYLEAVSEAWFVGAIRRQFFKTKHEIVPVLISAQGIGKGLGLKYTAGKDEWYVETTEPVTNAQKFLESARGSVVVELSEASQISDENNELLKSFISKSSDRYRKPYMHFEEDLPRHFVLVATSNKTHLFTDPTGNRRFFPFFCDGSRATRKFSESRTVGQYDVEQLWAEAYHLYSEGARWWITKETMESAAIMQDFCTIENQDIDVIDRFLDDPINGYTELGTVIDRDTILKEVFHLNPNQRVPVEIADSYNTWASKTGGCWESKGIQADKRSRMKKRFIRVAEPDTVPEINRLHIVDEPNDLKNEDGVNLTELFRETALKWGFTEPGSAIMPGIFDDNDTKIFLSSGYIRTDEYGIMRTGDVL